MQKGLHVLFLCAIIKTRTGNVTDSVTENVNGRTSLQGSRTCMTGSFAWMMFFQKRQRLRKQVRSRKEEVEHEKF